MLGSMNDTTSPPRSMANVALALSLAGLVPIPGIVASIAAVVCGRVAMNDAAVEDRSRARLATFLGLVGIVLPLLVLFVYCVLLGYPFPIHRYRPEQ
jgi:hypothetical protein